MLAKKVLLASDAGAADAARSGFLELDALCSSLDQHASSLDAEGRSAGSRRAEDEKVVLVSTADVASAEAIADHVARRLGAKGRVVRVSGGVAGEGFRLLAGSLSHRSAEEPPSSRGRSSSARDVGSWIVSALSGRADGGAAFAERGDPVAAILVVDHAASRFALAVAAEIDTALHCSSELATVLPPIVWIAPHLAAGAQATFGGAAGLASASRDGDRAPSSSAGGSKVRVLEVEGPLSREEIAVWWSAARAVGPTDEDAHLLDLEQWWKASRRSAERAAASQGRLSAEDSALARSRACRVLGFAGRPWPVDGLLQLGVASSDVEALVDRGLADVRADHRGRPIVVVRRADTALQSEEGAPSVEEADVVAQALEARFGDDPWALMRAAELHLKSGAVERGDTAALRAITCVADAEARADFWSRFDAASPKPSPSPDRLLPFVDVALRRGDGDWALRFARDAAAIPASEDASSYGAVLLSLGRALAQSGDLSLAALTLEKVTSLACASVDERVVAARACVELAEARYYASDLSGARASADDALARLSSLGSELSTATEPRALRRSTSLVGLDARNVLGKLLLAQADFTAAEQHFAADAFEASLMHEPVSELRARVNRAIAVMSLGRRAEAQAFLESVLAEAERAGELKAVGISLINLAALAIIDRRYGDALELSERAVEVLRRIGDKVALSRCVANLAELRARIGLIDEASQAVRFGVRVLRGALPPEQASRFALVLARVALARGDSSTASRHVTQALAALGATLSPDGSIGLAGARASADGKPAARGPVADHVSEALRLAARVALDDGDTARATVLIDRAAAERAPQRAKAELALLRAMLARSLGDACEAPATEALRAARDADDDELLREAHVLLYRAALDDGNTTVARHHIGAALALRDRIADGVPAALRQAFLSRSDLVALDREVRAFEQATAFSTTSPAAPSSRVEDSTGATSPSASAAPVTALAPAGARKMVGQDAAIRALQNAIRKVGPSDAIVLIHGESGTGKELVAEALHEASRRRGGPMVKVNCAALVETLLLSELFGHEKGAFTGAAGRRRGRFEAAEGGTLFLDEIGDISPRTQVALLRVLQEKTFERVGGTTSIRANVRVVCATHRNLKTLVARGEFREDLYYRLCGVTLEVPALRSRLGDIGALSDALLRRIAEERGGAVKTLSPSALHALKSHTWPGNIRELENALRAASLFAETDQLLPRDFADNVESLRHIADTVEALSFGVAAASQPGDLGGGPLSSAQGGVERAQADGMRSNPSVSFASTKDGGSSVGSVGPGSVGPASSGPVSAAPSSGTPSEVAYAQVRSGVSLHDMKRLIERECIVRALGDANGNITRAATLLGMKRPRLSQLVKQYGLAGGDASDDGEGSSWSKEVEEED